MYLVKSYLIATLCIFPSVVDAATIIKCTDTSGSVVFTENKDDCDKSKKHVSINYTENKHRTSKHKINYRIPQREYVKEKGKWEIYVESTLRDGDQSLYNSAIQKLNSVLTEVFSILPAQAAKKLSGLKYYILWGEKSPLGGRKKGMSYIRKGEPNNYEYLDTRWEHSIIVYSAVNLMYLSDLWAKKAITHELAHAWHLINWPDRHQPIYNSWQKTVASNRYVNVKDIKGKTIKNAYARKNHREYFAELSAIYFVGGNYYPYGRGGLVKYDPLGYKMVESLWKQN